MVSLSVSNNTKRTRVRYGRVKKFVGVHQRGSQRSSFGGFSVCVSEHKAHPGTLIRAGAENCLGSFAGFPKVELSWFLRLCKRTQSATGVLWQGSNKMLAASAKLPNFELSWLLRLCKRTQSAPGCAMVGSKHFRFISEVPKH